MELLNLTKDDIFKKKDIDDSNRIDFYETYSNTGIYNKEAYLQDRPIYNEFIKDYNIEPVNNNFNQMIHERKVKEEKEIAENLAEISIIPDPRITKYEDTYSLTPYATYILTPFSDIDGEDIVSRFDSCYGEWVTRHQDRCDINTEPCKRIKQHFKIHNPEYTGEHCRDEDGRRLRRGDTRHVFCNHYQKPKCNGHGECIRNNSSNTCVCNEGYGGPNCESTLPPAEQFKYNCCGTTGTCIEDISGVYSDMDSCNSECNKFTIVCPPNFCNNHGDISGGGDVACSCTCNEGYSGPNCEISSIIPCTSEDCNNHGTPSGNRPNCSCTCNASYIGKYCKHNKGENFKCDKFCYAGFIKGNSDDKCRQITDKDICKNAYVNQYENNIGKGCVWSGSGSDGVCGIIGVDKFYDTSNCPTTCCNGSPVCNYNASPPEHCPPDNKQQCPDCGNPEKCCCPPI